MGESRALHAIKEPKSRNETCNYLLTTSWAPISAFVDEATSMIPENNPSCSFDITSNALLWMQYTRK
jgi:hypothetical protein